jgi:hypothetical protein
MLDKETKQKLNFAVQAYHADKQCTNLKCLAANEMFLALESILCEGTITKDEIRLPLGVFDLVRQAYNKAKATINHN